MKTQALGRGLDALLGEMDEAYENEGSQKDSVIEISIDNISSNPFQPRKSFDEKALLELSESIKRDGLIQPIVVKEDIDGYIVIAGERRLKASKLAKKKTIKAIVIATSDIQMREFALLENIQREDLNSIELANAYTELLKVHGITHDELSGVIHKSRTHITNTIRLLQLSKDTQKALLDKKITAGHAKVLVGLDEQQQQLVVNSIIGQKLSVREVEAMIKNMKSLTTSKQEVKKDIPNFNFSFLEEKFTNLGLKVKPSGNKLTIEFKSENQIEDFLNFLDK